jgi:predicted TIM-barrel fold metal-dependent hydrolase
LLKKPNVPLIAIEEHYSDSELTALFTGRDAFAPPHVMKALEDVGEARLKDMDACGIDVQVLSHTAPSLQKLSSGTVELARRVNDRLAKIVATQPKRYAAFAALPTSDPAAAADELARCVEKLGFKGAMIHGLAHGQFVDDQRYWPIFARAEALDVPIYLHPGLPPRAVYEAYYDGLPGTTGFRLSTSAWGWHSETAIHVMRLVLSGALDRHPKLKLIIGHMGEGLAAMMVRSDKILTPEAPHLKRSVEQTILDQVWVTTSGLFTLPPLETLLAVFGPDRVMFSIDYPYSTNCTGRDFIDTLKLPAGDLEKFAHGNADRLLKLKNGTAKK